ncbi:MAG: galactokinase [Cyclobacteriaceae bacterium]|nr:galactokinase [Cyclobacteriaceae bacterium]
MQELAERLTREFRSRFHDDPLLFSAPGRINLIGEHVDYNDGFVLPGAIDKQMMFALAPGRSDVSQVYSLDMAEGLEFSANTLSPGHHWINYFMGVVAGFQERGVAVPAVNIVFGSSIPTGAGLSSSAALCCGFALALNQLTNAGLAKIDLAYIAQYSEHRFAGVMCGLMDQYAVLFGETGSLLLLDCRSMTHTEVALPPAAGTLMLVDSKVKHSLASSAYNNRRDACMEGVDVLRRTLPSIQSLRDVTPVQLEENKSKLSDEVYKRCRFVVAEIGRTKAACKAIQSQNWEMLGKLIYASHEGLSKEFQVSCDELDLLVRVAGQHPECVIGSRMMGGGFGGCTINLVRTGQEKSFQEFISKEYFTSFNTMPAFYSVKLSQGAHKI